MLGGAIWYCRAQPSFHFIQHDLGAWRYVSPAAKQLVRGLLTVDPKKRLTLDDLFNSAWIKVAEVDK